MTAEIVGAPETELRFASSDPNIVMADSTGRIFGASPGRAEVLAYISGSPLIQDRSVVVVSVPGTVETFFLAPSRLTLAVGDSAQTVYVNAGGSAVRYSSSDTGVATVDGFGKIFAIGIGTATITAQLEDRPQVTASSEVTVKAK
jgi:uncharacterized protein YjdB